MVFEVDFDEFAGGEGVAVFVLEGGVGFFGFGVEDFGGVAPGVLAVETEVYPAVAGGGEVEGSFGGGGDGGGVEDEEFFAVLVADPDFGLVGGEGDSVGAVGDGREGGEDAVDGFALEEIDDVEADVGSEADEGEGELVVDGEGEDAGFADVGDGFEEGGFLGVGGVGDVEDGEGGGGAEEEAGAVGGDEGVVGVLADSEALEFGARGAIDDDEAALGAFFPPARGGVDAGSVGGDAGAVATAGVEIFPEDLIGFEVEFAEASIGGGVIEGVGGEATRETTDAEVEVGVGDAADELEMVIDVEDEEGLAGATFGLGAVGGGAVEVAVDAVVGFDGEGGEGEEGEGEKEAGGHWGMVGWGGGGWEGEWGRWVLWGRV